jgi:hypothetical protein
MKPVEMVFLLLNVVGRGCIGVARGHSVAFIYDVESPLLSLIAGPRHLGLIERVRAKSFCSQTRIM